MMTDSNKNNIKPMRYDRLAKKAKMDNWGLSNASGVNQGNPVIPSSTKPSIWPKNNTQNRGKVNNAKIRPVRLVVRLIIHRPVVEIVTPTKVGQEKGIKMGANQGGWTEVRFLPSK